VEEALDLPSRFASLGKVANATKMTGLLALGNERAPLKAGVAACCLALAAGVGEEILFRGVLQQELTARLGSHLGLLGGSVIFGLMHAVTPTYAALAGIAGAYFGWVYNACGFSVAVPAIAHFLYDAVALIRVHLDVTGDPGKSGDDGDGGDDRMAGLQRTRKAQLAILESGTASAGSEV